jgi:pimeloyl-ACP methyl ester carboxylesterase
LSGPLVLLHGFMDGPQTWGLVLPALTRRHAVLAPALPGHIGGPPLPDAVSDALMADAVEHAMDDAGLATAHIAGNSLGGFVALQLAARGRARSVVAFAPAGGWAPGDDVPRQLFELQRQVHMRSRAVAGQAGALTATPDARRRALALVCEHGERVPAELAAETIVATARCDGDPLVDFALNNDWPLDVERIECPVRIVWGTSDRLLSWPAAAERFKRVLPHADWVELVGVGHAPQLDAPAETAALIPA